MDSDDKHRFARTLETEAWAIVSRKSFRQDDLSSGLEAVIALTLDQIQSVRQLERSLQYQLTKEENHLGTERLQVQDFISRYSASRRIELEKVFVRLSRVAEEKRRLKTWYVERLMPLQDKLVSLLNRHHQFDSMR